MHSGTVQCGGCSAVCGTCCCDGWRLPHPPGQHWGFLVRTIRSHTATNLFRLLTFFCTALSICNWRCYPVFYAQKSGWFESRLEIVKIANREFYGKGHSQICLKAESQVKPKAEMCWAFIIFCTTLAHSSWVLWLSGSGNNGIIIGMSSCVGPWRPVYICKGLLSPFILLHFLKASTALFVCLLRELHWVKNFKNWCCCCCCWIWLHTIASKAPVGLRKKVS